MAIVKKLASEEFVTTTVTTVVTEEVTTSLAAAKESGDFKGDKGADGISTTHSWNGTTLTITSASGTSSANLKGEAGDNGADGIGISSVTQTTTSTADDGNNIITVTLSNGNKSTFTVQNGSKGSKGDTGEAGAAGYSPVRGTDYWTDADKAEIKSYVEQAINNMSIVATSDANGNVTLSVLGGNVTIS